MIEVPWWMLLVVSVCYTVNVWTMGAATRKWKRERDDAVRITKRAVEAAERAQHLLDKCRRP